MLLIRGLILLLFVSSVYGQQCDYAGSQREMNECAVRDYRESDMALNEAYLQAMGKIPQEGQFLLREQQRDWIKRRDARCKAAKEEEGTNATIGYLTCMQSMTEVRTLQLEQLR